MKESIAQLLRSAFERAKEQGDLDSPSLPSLVVEIPRDSSHGDLSTNVAMRLARSEKKPPQLVARTLARHIVDEAGILASVDVAGPGFLNFRFTPAFWWKRLAEAALAGTAHGSSKVGCGKQAHVEFVSANPTGPLHFGHARGAVVGDVLCRLLAATGHRVVREYYVNDAGNQVSLLGASVYARYKQAGGLEGTVPADGYHGSYISELAEAIMKKEGGRWLSKPGEEAIGWFGEEAARILMGEIQADLESFGINFDSFVSERSLRETGEVAETLAELAGKGLVYEKDGAKWFCSSRFGDDKDRPLVKSGGDYTYFAVDVAYHKRKVLQGFDVIINIWGADHHSHVGRLCGAIKGLGLPAEKIEVLLVQMVSLTRRGEPVRMGKRSGEFVTMREVIDEVGRDAVRFFLLMRKADAHLDFDLELAKKQSSENPVFYVQYVHARVASILRNAAEAGLVTLPADRVELSRLELPEELSLIRQVARFPEVVEEAALSREPHRLVFFLLELAGEFHRYYNSCRVVTGDFELAQARLLLVVTVQGVIRNGLGLLGVKAPDKM